MGNAVRTAYGDGVVITYSILPDWGPVSKDKETAIRQIRWRLRYLGRIRPVHMMDGMELGSRICDLYDEMRKLMPELAVCETVSVLEARMVCPCPGAKRCTSKCFRAEEKFLGLPPSKRGAKLLIFANSQAQS